MRIVPASTSRRNPATMSGTSTSTATGIATTRSHWGIMHTSQQGRHDDPLTAVVHFFNSKPIAGTDTDTGDAVFRTQCSQDLHHLAVEFGGHETVAVCIEGGGCPHLDTDGHGLVTAELD